MHYRVGSRPWHLRQTCSPLDDDHLRLTLLIGHLLEGVGLLGRGPGLCMFRIEYRLCVGAVPIGVFVPLVVAEGDDTDDGQRQDDTDGKGLEFHVSLPPSGQRCTVSTSPRRQ